MLFFVLIALIIIVGVIAVHYNNHFESKFMKRYVNQRSKCEFKISPIDNQTYKFFPMAFFLYNIFIIILSTVIICICCINYIVSYNIKPESIIQLLFKFNLHKQQSITYIIFNYILSYGIMLLSIWDSLFAFYRSYSTYKTSTFSLLVSTTQILKLFSIYAIPFCVLYTIQINFFYWLFPPLIFMKLCFSICCHCKFVQSIKQADATPDHQLIKSVSYLWKTSVIYAILQSISLGLFLSLMKYNLNIIYFLPLLWCCISSIYCTNFVRNKNFLCKQRSKYCDIFKQNKATPKWENVNSNSIKSFEDDNLEEFDAEIQNVNAMKHECEDLLESDSDDKYEANESGTVFLAESDSVQILDTNQRMTFVFKSGSVRGNNMCDYAECDMPTMCDVSDIDIIGVSELNLDTDDENQSDIQNDCKNVNQSEIENDENEYDDNNNLSTLQLVQTMKGFGFC
eukprot:539882_1